MGRFFSLSTRHYRWLAVLWTIGIVVAFSLPPRSLSSVQPALSYDKLAHAVLFAVFASLWMRVLCPPEATPSSWRLSRYGLLLLVMGGIFAAGSELYQHVLPVRRTGDPYDFLADGVGLLLGIGLYAWGVRRRTRSVSFPDARS
jgi:hypothetical protein